MRALNSADTVSMLLVDAAGAPLTGLVAADVALYYRKDAGSPVEKTLTSDNFAELDATNMPGVYEVAFTALEFDTRGEFTFVITEVGASGVAQYTQTLQIGASVAGGESLYTRSETVGSELTLLVPLVRDGTAVTGLTGASVSTDVVINGTSAVNTVFDSLTEVGQGLYTVTLGDAFTQEPGTVVTQVRPLNPIPRDLVDLGYSLTSATSVWAASRTRNAVDVWVTDFFDTDQVAFSSDRGDTFTNIEFRSGGGFTKRPSGVAGDVEDPDRIVVAAWESNGDLGFAYYTEDGGETWTEAVDFFAPATLTTTRRCAVQPGGTAFFVIGQTAGGDGILYQGAFFSPILSASSTHVGIEVYDVDVPTSNSIVLVGETGGGAAYVRRATGGFALVAPSVLPAVDGLRAVHLFPGSGSGFAVGDNGTVIYTTDTGDNWTDVTANTGTVQALTGVHMVSATEAYVVGESGTLIYTNDAGATFSVPPEAAAIGLTIQDTYVADSAVFLPQANTGDRLELGKQAADFDAARLWVELEPASALDTVIGTLRAELSRQRPGYVLDIETEHVSTLYLSRDGEPNTGVSGSALTSLLFKAGASAVNTVNTTLTELDDAALPGWYSVTLGVGDTNVAGDLVLDLRAGGLAITNAEQQSDPGGVEDSGNGVYAVSNTVAYIARGNGFGGGEVISTINGGTAWTSLGGVNFTDRCVQGVPGTDFLLVGGEDSGQPYISFSDDAGANFDLATEDSFAVFASIRDMAAPSTQLFYGVAGGNVVVVDRTVNANLQVVLYNEGDLGSFGQFFTGIDAQLSGTILAVGNDGTTDGFAIRSDDSGASWATVPMPTTDILTDVDFVSGTLTGWVVGQNGQIFKTVDGGASFSAQTSGVATTLNGVIAVSTTQAWVVGAAGVVLYTQDGGTTWQSSGVVDAITAGPPVADLDSIDGANGVLWATGQSDGDVYILRIDALSAAIDPVTLRYRVTSGAAVDLSPVTDALTDIQGAGFNTATDSLKILSDGADTQSTAISTLSTDVGTVQTDLTAVQGDVTAISTDVGTLSTDVGTLTTEVGTISTDVGTLTTDVGTLTTDVGAISTDLGEIQILITRILGLSQENIRITDHAYDGSGNLIGATIRTYPTAVDVANETNAIASYVLEAVYDVSNRLDDYSIRRA